MDSLYILIPIAVVFCFVAIRLLIWAIGSGQYDDLDKEAWRILMDESPDTPSESDAEAKKNEAGENLGDR